MILKLYIGNDVMDLFQDESIEINSSIANVNDITKNTTDYAKSFTVPASHINNRIFKHYYDANIDNAFDARVKVSGRIELDGFPFRFGKWSLEKVSVKQGKPYAYSINFVGNLVSLKDKLKNDELSSLDYLSIYNHGYNSAQVKLLLQGGNDLVYNLFVKKQLYYKSGSENINTDKLANIAYTGGSNTGVNWDLLRPSLRVLRIIEAIEIKYNIVFSRDFFGSTEFRNLFLWVNNDSEKNKSNNEVKIDITTNGTLSLSDVDIDLVEDTIKAKTNVLYMIVQITPIAGYEDITYAIERRKNGTSSGGFYNVKGTKSGNFIFTDQSLYTWHIISNQEFKFTIKFSLYSFFSGAKGVANFPEQTISAELNVPLNMPKIKIIDFLKGLFQTFKLVIISDDNEDLYVDTIDNYYTKGKVWNISRYVKTDTLEVSRGNLLNELKFSFKDPSTILNKQFKINTGLGYGDESVLLTDDGTPSGLPLEGEALSVELPFEQIIYERLPDLGDDNELTNIQYGGIFDDKIEPINPAPHIFYNINTAIGTKTIGWINDVGVREQLTGNINTPSHSIDWETPQYNLTFGIENNEWTNISSENTLYSNHHKNYVESIFNIKRRSFKYNAVLPLRIMLQLKLNDILEIKNNYYRIDNFNFNLLNRNVSLNLFNAFDLVIDGFNSDVTVLIGDYTNQTQSISIPNIGNSTISVDDDTWINTAILGTNVYFEFEQNNTGLERTNTATITNTDTLQEIVIFITQYGTTVTFDNGEITFDTNLITFDNG